MLGADDIGWRSRGYKDRVKGSNEYVLVRFRRKSTG
jgi:hypothetical protein